MKKIIVIIAMALGCISNAQTAIGKSGTTNASCLLEFGAEARGIRLPLVSDASALTVSPGTLAFDAATGSFRYNQGTWSAVTSGGSTGGSPTGTDSGGPVIIGADSTTKVGGALILEASDKALVLPTINNAEIRILSPTKGLMAWDSAKRQVAVYNGSKWCFY
jgi:hypothetical protein